MAITPNAFSIRERIMQALETLFKDQKKGIGSDPYLFAWDSVTREPISDLEKRKGYALAVLEGPETKVAGAGFQQPRLNLILEWHTLMPVKVIPATHANCILMTMHRVIRSDRTLGGLCIDVQETGNSFEVEDFKDRQIEGDMTCDVIYKHNWDDPRAIINT